MIEIHSRSELGKLYEKHKKTGHGAEIGVKEGWNAKQIMAHYTGTIHLFDRWTDWDDMLQCVINMKGKDFRMYKGDSVRIGKTFDEQLDWVYLDAGHNYEEVFEDHKYWSEKVCKGGIVSGHDYSPKFPGVMKFVDELIAEGVDVQFTWNDFYEGVPYQSWWYVKQ